MSNRNKNNSGYLIATVVIVIGGLVLVKWLGESRDSVCEGYYGKGFKAVYIRSDIAGCSKAGHPIMGYSE